MVQENLRSIAQAGRICMVYRSPRMDVMLLSSSQDAERNNESTQRSRRLSELGCGNNPEFSGDWVKLFECWRQIQQMSMHVCFRMWC